MAGTTVDPADLISRAMQQRGLEAPAAAPQGADPAAAAAAAQQAAQQQTEAAKGAAAAAVQEASSAAEKAAGAKAEGDAATDAPIKIMRDGKEIELTPSQILGTLDRYKSLNYKQMRLKPAMSIVEKLMEQAGGGDDAAEKVAQLLEQGIAAVAGKGQQGKPEGQNKPEGQGAPANGEQAAAGTQGGEAAEGDDFDWDKWGEENEIAVPAPFKKLSEEQRSMKEEIKAGTELLTQLVQAIQVIGQSQMGGQQQREEQKRDVALELIKRNLATMQAEHELPNEDEPAFYEFMMDRGYTPADLLDMDVVRKLGGDFKAVRSTDEFKRLQSIAQRRSAVAGSIDSSPGNGGGGNAPANADTEFFDRMVKTKLGG